MKDVLKDKFSNFLDGWIRSSTIAALFLADLFLHVIFLFESDIGSYHDYMGSSKKWILCEDHICHNRIVLHIRSIPGNHLESKRK